MKNYKKMLASILLLVANVSVAQTKFEGSWIGSLEVAPNKNLEMVFHIKQETNGFSANFDVPQQKQFGIPFNAVSVQGNQLNLELSAANMKFSGKFKENIIDGEYTQHGFKAPLILKPTSTATTRKAREQEPKGARPYTNENVTFENQVDKVVLAGTLSIPASLPKAAVVLISGSGPTNRDADIAGHKWFLVLADQLASQGIAVLRYDDRGVGNSTGDFSKATSEDFASDAHSALQFLKQNTSLNSIPVGYIGHSEGGLIATIAASKNQQADFMVSMAGAGTTGAQILIDQSYHIQKLMGMDDAALAQDDLHQKAIMAAIKSNKDKAELKSLLLAQGNKEEVAEAKSTVYVSDWFSYFVKADPTEYMKNLTLPVLALNGDKDSQVLAPQNIQGFKDAVYHKLLTTKIYPDLNHLFQPAKTGLPNEYGDIETTISVSVANDISKWIDSLINKKYASL